MREREREREPVIIILWLVYGVIDRVSNPLLSHFTWTSLLPSTGR